jgi:ubiquinone/menaquinone biosynthesis C-methylase UbiE
MVKMARESLERFGQDPDQAARASALDLPFADCRFDSVIAIGSLHHTGNLQLGISEAGRVLKPGGALILMVYNARSVNRLVTVPVARAAAKLLPARADWILTRTHRDHSLDMETAPHTDFVTARQLLSLLAEFSDKRIDLHGASPFTVHGRVLVGAERLEPLLRHGGALDLYAVAHR